MAYQGHPVNALYQAVKPMSEEAAKRFLSEMAAIDFRKADGWIMFAVELSCEQRMIGEVGIFISPAPQSKGDLGWSFHPDYHQQGYATEAATVLIDYAFRERRLHRLTATCEVHNTASIRLMERLGMRRESHYRKSHFANGAWQDEYLYALLRDERLTTWPHG